MALVRIVKERKQNKTSLARVDLQAFLVNGSPSPPSVGVERSKAVAVLNSGPFHSTM